MPILKGLIHELTPLPGVTPEENLGGLFQGAFINDFSQVNFVPLAEAKVFFGLHLGGLSAGFFPSLSQQTESRADGKFEIDIPSFLANVEQAQGFLVAYKQVERVRLPNRLPIRILAPVYRSEPFLLSAVDEQVRIQLLAAPLKTADTQGVRAGTINSQIADVLASLAEENEDLEHIEAITASLAANGLRFAVEAALETKGTFELQLSPNTGASAPVLDSDFLLRAKIANIQVEKGNFAGRLCRTRAKLEEGIAGQARGFTKAFSAAAIAQVKATMQAQGPEGTLGALLLDPCFSLTASAVRFPLVDRPGPALGQERVMVLDISFGYPRNPVTPLGGCNIPALP